jgi:hypothetical protein
MKISPIQILASAAGAVASAVIASFFGVQGTVIGVAVGSAVATLSTAVVAESIRRTHRAVRHVVGPTAPGLLRRVGDTAPTGEVTHEVDEPPASVAGGVAASVSPREPTAVVPAPRRPVPAAPDCGRPPSGPRVRWGLLVGAVVAVFAVGLLAVTGIELLAGKPLASLVGASKDQGGISLAPTATTTTTTSSTTTTTSTSTTTTSTSTTTTTAPGATSTTTTTAPGATSTTTTLPATTTTPSAGALGGTGPGGGTPGASSGAAGG